MPRIQLWRDSRSSDFYFADQQVAENIFQGGTAIRIHKYMGPKGGGDITDIGDLLFLENRDRNYSDVLYELRGVYNTKDIEFDLTQFGILIADDTILVKFHYNTMVDVIGRKLMSGDVMEVLHMRNFDPLDPASKPINAFYVIDDASYHYESYGNTWWPHVWKVKARPLTDSTEFDDILDRESDSGFAGWGDVGHGGDNYTEGGDNGGNDTIRSILSTYCKELCITDGIVEEAEQNMFYDPKFFEEAHMYVLTDEKNTPYIQYWRTGDGMPPNGTPLKGEGNAFPDDMEDGDYFLRLDFQPNRLFQKQGNKFMKIEDDIRKIWTAYNKVLDTHIDNDNITTLDDGTKVPEKQALSKAVKARKDPYAEHKKEITAKEKLRQARRKAIDEGRWDITD